MHLEKKFHVSAGADDVYRCIANDETLLGLFPETRTEIVASDGNQRTLRSHYIALGQSGVATFHFVYEPDRGVSFEKVCDGRVWSRLVGAVRLVERGDRTQVSIELDGRTKTLVPEFTIKAPMQDQLRKMVQGLRQRLEAL